MSLVEDTYRAAIDAMTPAQKIARMLQLNQWAHWNIERRIAAERGPVSPEIMKWEVALWVYGRNPACRELIEEHLARVRTE